MATRIKDLDVVWPLIERLPLGTYFDVDEKEDKPMLRVQAWTRDAVKKVRASLPSTVWRKVKNERLSWWEYSATIQGVYVEIYADREGPSSCKRITEEIEEVVHVPAREAHDEIKKRTVVKWICPEEDADGKYARQTVLSSQGE